MTDDAEGSIVMPLAGKTIVVTRSAEQAPNLVVGLEKLGARIVEFPTIDIRLLAVDIPAEMPKIDWIVFTSGNAVRGLHSSARSENLMLRFPTVKICCVGPATEEVAKGIGFPVDLLPDVYTAGDILAALEEREKSLEGKRILIPRGNLANPRLRERLLAAGAKVETLIVYETVCPPANDDSLAALLEARPDMITFTSGSTVKNFVSLVGTENMAKLSLKTAYASIGPQTTKAAQANGLEVYVEPEQHDIPGLTEAIRDFYS